MRNKANWISFYTLVRHECVRILRIWPQTFAPPVITTCLYYIIFGNVVGAKIGSMSGFPYIQYIMPGLVMMTVVDNAFVNVNFSFFTHKFFRSIEEMLVTPMPNHAILCGFVSGGVMRSIVVGCIVALMSLLFTKITVYSWPLTLLIVFLTAIFMSLVGFVAGIYARKFDDLSIIPMFILTPLNFFGGVFYSVNLLPPFWKALTHVNPIFYMISGFRYAILGVSDVDVVHVLLMLTLGSAALYGLSYWMLQRGVGIKS